MDHDFAQAKALWKHVAEVLPFIMFAYWSVRKRYLERLDNAVSECYAVTNTRLMVWDRSKRQFFAEADLVQVQTMRKEEFASGVGTISFGGKYNNDLDFSLLENLGEVRKIIDEAKRQIDGSSIEWVDVVAERAKKHRPTLGSRLGCFGFLFLVMIPYLYLFFQKPIARFYASYYTIRYYSPGVRHFQRGEYAAAIPDLSVAANTTRDGQIYYTLGLALMRQTRYDAALVAFQTASRLALANDTPNHELDAKAKTMIAKIDAAKKR